MPLAALSHDLMAAVRPDGRIAWANPAWRRLLGWSEEELTGMPFAELIRSGDAAAMLDGTELVLDVATRSGGKRRIVFASARADGLTYVCGRDVAQIEEIEHELRAADERFRVITEATHEAILVADGRGRITFSNRGATTVFGWQPHELLGHDRQRPVLVGLVGHVGLVRLDLDELLASLDLVPVGLQPLEDRALLHRVGQAGHRDIGHARQGIRHALRAAFRRPRPRARGRAA
jgi:PAS domain S-box-containing protein